MMVQVFYIPTESAPHAWLTLGGFVNKAARRYKRDYDLDDIRDAIFDGDAALFGVLVGDEPVAAIVTSETIYPKRKVMEVELVGGSRIGEWWEQAMTQLIAVAKEMGYNAVTTRARPGWRKMAKSFNFRQAYVAYELELN